MSRKNTSEAYYAYRLLRSRREGNRRGRKETLSRIEKNLPGTWLSHATRRYEKKCLFESFTSENVHFVVPLEKNIAYNFIAF
ncbi:MAG: hypothetical protein B5M56_01685 [Desulfococcus sp. 4484_241]|nr:MAG: hypothetical protein B5M56_01685 [Desulfococcus sp. 4484_241]